MHKKTTDESNTLPGDRPAELGDHDVEVTGGGYGDAGEQVYLAVELKKATVTNERASRVTSEPVKGD